MLWRIVLPPLAVASALAGGLLLRKPIGEPALVVALLVAVAATTRMAGRKAGIGAVVLGAIAGGYVAAPPLGTAWDLRSMVLHAITFLAGGALIVRLVGYRAHSFPPSLLRQTTPGADGRFRGLLESVPDALITADEGGTILLVNTKTEDLFQYSRTEMLGRHVSMLLAAPDVDGISAPDFWKTGRSSPNTGIDLIGRRRDNSEFPAEITLSPLDSDGRVLVTGVVRDLTERRKAEEHRATLIREQAARVAAENAERRAAFLAEASRVLAGSLDYHTTLSSVTRLAVPQLADWCAVDVVEDDGRIHALAVAHADAARTQRARGLRERFCIDESGPSGVSQVVRSGRSAIFDDLPSALLPTATPEPEEVQAVTALGCHSAMIVPMIARNRTLGAMTLVVGEPARRYGLSDLAFAEELARHAALAVENARLYASAQRERAGAEQASRMKDEFLATLSHELRTPLNAMLGWMRLLMSGALDAPATQRALETIERNGLAQAQVIDDLLDVSRMMTGQLRLSVTPMNLVPVIQEALEAARAAAEAKHLHVHALLDPGAAPVSGDRDRLRQVFWNLLSNAVKFTPAGGRVQVRLARVGPDVEVAVSDTGIGIEPQFQPFVFDRFRLADPSSTRVNSGLGLGLAVARDLVELHGGTVRVESGGAGKGTTFTVCLPLRSTKGSKLHLASDRTANGH